MPTVKAFTVVFNTPDLLMDSVGSFREHYPDMPLLIMNNSDPENECSSIIIKMQKDFDNISAFHYGENCGHGDAFNHAVSMLECDYIYYFDSDINMLEGGAIEEMLKIMNENVYGVGNIIYTSMVGHVIKKDYVGERLRFLYFVCGLLNRRMYYNFHRWTKLGLIGIKAFLEIHETGRADELLRDFPIFGYVKHLSGGTRARFGDCESMALSDRACNLVAQK